MTDTELTIIILNAWEREVLSRANAASVGLEPNYSAVEFKALIEAELAQSNLPRDTDGQGSSMNRFKKEGR